MGAQVDYRCADSGSSGPPAIELPARGFPATATAVQRQSVVADRHFVPVPGDQAAEPIDDFASRAAVLGDSERRPPDDNADLHD